jgi:hypothetical protein
MECRHAAIAPNAYRCTCYCRALGPQQGEGRILPRVADRAGKLPEYRLAKQRGQRIALGLSFSFFARKPFAAVISIGYPAASTNQNNQGGQSDAS